MLEQSAKWLARWISGMEGLLAPKPSVCLCCGAAHRYECRLPLCQRCWEAIPWIHEVACAVCGRFEACPDCARREERWFVQSRSAVRYDEQMKEWLGLYKYRGKERLGALFGPMLLHAYHLHRQASLLQRPEATEIITFVPLSEPRRLERGFNQAEKMALELGRLTNKPVVPLLRRIRHTDKQSLKVRAQRLEDLRGAFDLEDRNGARLAEACRKRPIRVYLVDDVYTTGSTLNECAQIIASCGKLEICGINWAR